MTIIGPRNVSEKTMPEFLKTALWNFKNTMYQTKFWALLDTLKTLKNWNENVRDMFLKTRTSTTVNCKKRVHNWAILMTTCPGQPDDSQGGKYGPTIIPVQSLGVIDARATYVGDSETLSNAMVNMSTNGKEEKYTIRRGNVPYNVHVCWALQYSDTRYCHHGQFIFQAFGILQKRQVAASASLQVSKKVFLQHQDVFRSLTSKDLQIASMEESRKVPFLNPTIKALHKQLSTVCAKVMGTDELRIKIWGQIKGMNVMKGPPSLWITINPSNVGDPIAQVFASEQIDLDAFKKTTGPNSTQRNLNIVGDPYVAAKFFHFVIVVLIEKLFGIHSHTNSWHVRRTDGIFGKVASYIGTIEAQGHGTLHLHIVVWLVGALTHVQMKQALKSKTFRSKVESYIKANIRADLDGADKEHVLRMPRQNPVSYSRPINPRRPNYSLFSKTTELQLARMVKLHTCDKTTCLISKKGAIYCKQRVPFDLCTRDYVDENGSWGPKQSYTYINGWCPPIMQCIRANQDIKLITSGAETMDISFYISMMCVKRHRHTFEKTNAIINMDKLLVSGEADDSDFVELTTVRGILEIKDQLKEYIDRGLALSTTCLLNFFLNTYEWDKTKVSSSGTGHKPNERVPYLEGTGHGRKCRVVRTAGHETIPNLVGEWFPRNNIPELQEYYYVSMLALLTPWTDIRQLKHGHQTFQQTFDVFVANAPAETIQIIENIQYQYESSDSAQKKREQCAREDKNRSTNGATHNMDMPVNLCQLTESVDQNRLFVEVAINIAFNKGIFNENTPKTIWKNVQRSANHEDMIYFQELEKMVKLVTKNHQIADKTKDIQPQDVSGFGQGHETQPDVQMLPKSNTYFAYVDILNSEQSLAHEIISNHLKAHLDGKKLKQLLMMCMGQGSTGNLTFLNALTTTFQKYDVSHLLGKTAMSGIAGSLIGGMTLHWYAGLPPQMNPQSDIWPENPSKYIRERRTKNLQPIEWLAIDEMGMCTLDLLTLLSQVAGKARVDNSRANATVPFRGLNLILIGDFHQFPPVGAASSAICARYAFTDHKAQGQMLEHVIIVIGTTVKFPVNSFATYVTLSRSRGRETIRLLRDFDASIFTKNPLEFL
ncbi:hypothetical protein PILCRDRAFT_92659 [Piloderma croceum F 1598]|uniref:ATP-dependent DNA helicase n=1 Tax=Piloderma croceum (strain F 1598) TaxID=765440 RepID=A0A0C3AK67_PILCF|nr:hypothetical protein PILCRDRAFT_92659 [Piloderma croceum F 1598]